MTILQGTGFGGASADFWVDPQQPPGGGKITGTKVFVNAPGGALMELSLSSGVYLPTQFVASDISGQAIPVGDSSNNALRALIVGGSDSLHIDGTSYQRIVNSGLAVQFITGDPGDLGPDVAGAARMTRDGVVHTAGIPRENTVQNTGIFQNTSEFTVLIPAGPGIFLDLTGVWVSSTSENAATVVLLRDAFGGIVRFPLAISKSGGSNPPFRNAFNQIVPNNPWTVQLLTSVFPDTIYVTLQAEKRTAS